MTPRWMMRVPTACLGLIPVIQLIFLSWIGTNYPQPAGMGPGGMAFGSPGIALPVAVGILVWTVILMSLKTPSVIHLTGHAVVMLLVALQVSVASVRIGYWSGFTDKLNSVEAEEPPATKEDTLTAILKAGEGGQALGSNKKVISGATRDRVLAYLIDGAGMFKPSDRDCRAPLKGPMMELAPARVISLERKQGGRVEINLFEFDSAHRVLQIHTFAPEAFWWTDDDELINKIYAMSDLK